MKLLKKIWPKNKESLAIALIVLLAAFLRLYKIEFLTTFLGEQGRDLLIAREILEGKLTLLGPPTSISAVHFGPFYHYFNAFFLFLFRLDPLGPVFGFVLLSLVSVYLIYSLASAFGHKRAGLFAAFLFAVSPRMVEYGRHVFNSNFMHNFSVVSVWFLVNFFKTRKRRYLLLLSGIFAGLALQANFLSIGLFAGLFFYLLWEKLSFKKQLWFYLGSFLAIFPYLIFELRHQFYNSKAFLSLFGSGRAVVFSGLSFLQKMALALWQSLYFSFSYQRAFWLSASIFLCILIGTIFLLLQKQKNKFLKLNLIFIFFILVVVSLYPGPMLVHYLGAVYPFIFLVTGLAFERATGGKAKYFAYFIFLGLLLLNLLKINYSCNGECSMPQGWDLRGVKEAGRIIGEDASEGFNVAALLDGDTRAYPYRYIIEVAGKKPLGVEEYPESLVLYVVARGSEEEVLSYPVWEISSFLPAKVTKVWPIKNEISVFKLEKINQEK